MPVRKSGKTSGVNIEPQKSNNHEDMEDDNVTYKFVKDEIVWAKMKFFSAWPAKVRIKELTNLKKWRTTRMIIDYAGLIPFLRALSNSLHLYRCNMTSQCAEKTTRRRNRLRLKYRYVFSTILPR